MYKKLVGTIALMLSMVCAQAVFADESMCHQGLQKLVSSLNLKDDQMAKIKPIVDQMTSAMKDNGAKMDELKSQIREQVTSATMDQDKMNGLVDQKAALIGNMMKARFSAENQIFAILTPEQKTNMIKMMDTAEEKIAAKYKSCQGDD